MERTKPISPADALARADGMPSDFEIRVINDVITAIIMKNPNKAYTGFIVDYNALEDALFKAHQKQPALTHNYNWKRFPAVFSEYWDIEIHSKTNPSTGRRTFSHYVFRPRGTKIIHDTHDS